MTDMGETIDLGLTRIADMVDGDQFRWGGEMHTVAGFRQIMGATEHVALETAEGRTFRTHRGMMLYAECVPRDDGWDG